MPCLSNITQKAISMLTQLRALVVVCHCHLFPHEYLGFISATVEWVATTHDNQLQLHIYVYRFLNHLCSYKVNLPHQSGTRLMHILCVYLVVYDTRNKQKTNFMNFTSDGNMCFVLPYNNSSHVQWLRRCLHMKREKKN